MNQNARRGPRLSVGGSSILVIFVILTLTTFATLSLASSTADHNLSKKNVTAAENYYTADAEAEEMLAQIDAELMKIPAGNRYLEECEAALGTMEGVEAYWDDSGALIAGYAVEVSEIQTLTVEIEILNSPDARYNRRQWVVVTQAEDDEEDAVNLWGGDGDIGLFADDFEMEIADVPAS